MSHHIDDEAFTIAERRQRIFAYGIYEALAPLYYPICLSVSENDFLTHFLRQLRAGHDAQTPLVKSLEI